MAQVWNSIWGNWDWRRTEIVSNCVSFLLFWIALVTVACQAAHPAYKDALVYEVQGCLIYFDLFDANNIQ